MKVQINNTHPISTPTLKEGDIVQDLRSGDVYILGKRNPSHSQQFFYASVEADGVKLVQTSGGFPSGDYKLFKGTITLSNEA